MLFNFYKKKLYLIIFSIILLIFSSWLFYKIVSDNLEEECFINSDSRIVVYTKSNCCFCQETEKLLNKYQLHYSIINLDNNKSLHTALAEQTNHTTVPYIFINHKFLGGFAELKKTLEKKSD